MIAYLIGVALGAFMTVWGVMHNDAALVTSGLALVGVGGTASGALAKQRVSTPDSRNVTGRQLDKGVPACGVSTSY